MKDRSDDSSHHERTLLAWSYISFPRHGEGNLKDNFKEEINFLEKSNMTIIRQVYMSKHMNDYLQIETCLAGRPDRSRLL